MRTKLLFILLLTGNILIAQNKGITGRIIDTQNQPLVGVTILEKNTTNGALSDANGNFVLENYPNEPFTILISYIGYNTKEIKIQPNESNDLGEIIMYEGNEILNEVKISSKRINKFSRKETAYVAKLPLKDIDNSQVYSTITNELLKSQVVTNFDDALKNATGVESLWTSTGRGGDGAGYYSLRGFSIQPQLVNGMPGLTNGTINPANIERIEVLKGPSATLFGSSVSAYGGLINVVTKKPYIGKGGELSYTGGSFDFNQVVFDINTNVNNNEKLYFRINTAYTKQQSFQDAGFTKSFFIAPSLSYQVNNKLSFNFYGEITQAEQTNPMMLFFNRGGELTAKTLDELGYDPELSFTSNDLTLKNPTQNYRGEMSYKISDQWTWQTVISRSSTSTTGYYTYLYDYANFEEQTFTRVMNKQNATTNTGDIQLNLMGNFNLGQLKNKMVFGLDYYSVNDLDQGSSYVTFGYVRADGSAVEDIESTTTIDESADTPLTTAAADVALSGASTSNSKARTRTYSAYFSDVISFNKQLSLMLGLRLDYFDNIGEVTDDTDDYNQTALSPKVGVVYQPIDDQLSIFANYQNGFTNVAPSSVTVDGNTYLKNFEPEHANQYEVGVKTQLFHNRLNAIISYYNIDVTNATMTDPENTQNTIQDGEIESKGYEIEINANPVDGLNIRGGFSHNDNEVIDGNSYIKGTRMLAAGPENQYNAWASYEIQENDFKGFGLALGANGSGERYIMNWTFTGDFILPAFCVLNGSLFYQADNYRISFKANNMLDKEYYKGWSTLTPQNPRNFAINLSFQF